MTTSPLRQTCLITGSTTGLGKATALQLAKLGWQIIIHGRNAADCQAVQKELRANSDNPNIEYVAADLSLMAEAARMAAEVKNRFPKLNVLVNNAGTFNLKRIITSEGLELTWAVNYLVRLVLTTRLLDLLKSNAPARIVNVAGAYHTKGQIYFDDNTIENNYSMAKANNQSKLADILFTYFLAEKLKGSGVTINCLHPGVVNTGSVLRSADFPWLAKFMYRLFSPLTKSPEQGAATTVYLASSPAVEGVSGKYFVDKKERKSSNSSYDRELQQRLWEFSAGQIRGLLRD